MLIAYDHISSFSSEDFKSFLQASFLRSLNLNKINSVSLRETLLGRKLLADLFIQFGTTYSLSNIKYHSSGKPYLPGGPFFSIAHSEGMVMVCAAHNEIGVDIEQIPSEGKIIPRTMLHSKLLAYAGEQNWIKAWVHQEAVAKMFGWPLLTEILKVKWLNLYQAVYQQKEVVLKPLSVLDHYYAAICMEGNFLDDPVVLMTDDG